tara:strand:- start:413 stop:1219 length:807 start_codon:yes stop_codon:yes gene_type:complete
MKVYDCITFFNEEELLELRLNILNKHVDYFVICEAREDHRGNSKKLYFNLSKFNKFKEKIIYLIVDKFENCKRTWDRQNFQRDYLINGIKNADKDDLILFSDIDEIPNLEKLNSFTSQINSKIGIFDQKVFYYKLNLNVLDYNQWEGTRVSKKKYIKSFSWLREHVRLKNLKYGFWRIDKFKKIFKVSNGGWHFSFLGDANLISSKIKSYVHSEFDETKFTNIEEINKRIQNNLDPYDRKKILKKISIDDTYPDFILQNRERLKKFII